MRYLPIELDVAGREALVVGSGAEIVAKIDRLIEAGARVTVIAEGDPGEAVEERARRGAITLLRRALEDADLDGKAVTFLSPFTTPEGEARARRLHAAALRDGRLVCAVDRPEASTFASAAVVRASGLTMTVSTGGASPALARRLRQDLEAIFGDPRVARFVDALRAAREALPRGERAARMGEAVEGFALQARLRFPDWFERGDDPDGTRGVSSGP
jgi:precorrin-2 dehydrogenase / sirohydrochlorin ferrochelatase